MDTEAADSHKVVSTDIFRQYTAAMRAVKPRARQWIRKLPEFRFQRWKASRSMLIPDPTLHRWLRRPEVIRALDLQQQYELAKLDLSANRVMQEYEAIAFADPRDAFNADGTRKKVHELDARTAAAVAELEVDAAGKAIPTKFHQKRHALDTLQRLHNLAPQRHEVTGKDGAPLIPQQTSARDLARRVLFLLKKGAAQPAT